MSTEHVIERRFTRHTSELERARDRRKLAWVLEELVTQLGHHLERGEPAAPQGVYDACNELIERPSAWPFRLTPNDEWADLRAVHRWLAARSQWLMTTDVASRAADDLESPFYESDSDHARAQQLAALRRLVSAGIDLAAHVATVAVHARDKTRLLEPELAGCFHALHEVACSLGHPPPSEGAPAAQSWSTRDVPT